MSNALLALLAQRKAQFSNQKTLKPSEGRNRYRLLGSWRKVENAPKGLTEEQAGLWAAQFYQDFGQHFIKDAAGAVKAVYVCADKTFGRPCAICDEVNRGIANTHDDATLKRLNDAKAGGRVLLNVLHLDGPTPNEVQVLEIAPSAFNGKKGVGGIVSLFQDWPGMLNTDLTGAADIIIEKSGKGMDTAYGVSAVPSQTVVNAAQVSKIHDLDKFVAQENAAGAQRALASVSAITGLLPAPARPSLDTLANSQVFDDVPDFPTQAAAAPAVQQVAMPAPAVAAVAVAAPTPAPAPAPAASPDADLMDLLKDL